MVFLQWIEATGSQYIQTGFIPNGNTTIELDCDPDNKGSNQGIFSARSIASGTDPTSLTLFIISSSGTYRYDHYGSSNTISVSDVYARAFIKTTKNSISIGDVSKAIAESSASSEVQLHLLASVSAENFVTSYFQGKLYSVQIWDDGTLIRDMWPWKDDSGTIGMIDKLTGTFYTSASTTAFVAGPDAVWNVSIIESKHISVTASKNNVTDGDSISFTIIPDEGYDVISFYVNDVSYDVPKSGGTVEIPNVNSDLIVRAYSSISIPLPQLMFKIWDGDVAERFTYEDMNRIEFNANRIAENIGVETTEFMENTRAGQFRYDEANLLESFIHEIGVLCGLDLQMETRWSYNRTVSYVDFERWESSLYQCYQILGGIGERIPADKVLVVVSATLFADGWQGTGPYHQDLEVPAMNADRESVVYLHHSADLWQRVAEYNALLLAEPMEGVLRVNALSIKPDRNLPIRIQFGGFETMEIVTLKANAWEGPENGPWTQTVALSGPVRDGIIGAQSGMTAAQAQAFTEGAIHSTGVDGSDMTVRAMYRKPTIDLPVGIVWNADEVA